jgi:hypothetical protein
MDAEVTLTDVVSYPTTVVLIYVVSRCLPFLCVFLLHLIKGKDDAKSFADAVDRWVAPLRRRPSRPRTAIKACDVTKAPHSE